MGIGRVFRPLVSASPGYGIRAADLSPIEGGVAARGLRDEGLIAAFNEGDVYVATAKRIFAARLSAADLSLPPAEFKKKHKRLREQTKPLVLGIIYGKTVPGIAAALKTPVAEA